MSLINCPECGAKISEQAPRCPNCGCPSSVILEKSIMICSECGCEHERGLANCPQCGFPNPNRVQYQTHGQIDTLPGAEKHNNYHADFSEHKQDNHLQSCSETRSVGFGEAIRICCVKKYATFSGRASRSEYWFFALFTWLITIIPNCIYLGYRSDYEYLPNNLRVICMISFFIVLFLSLILFLPTLGVIVRRLHDSNKSGFWLLLVLVPIIGALIVFIFTLLPSDPYENEYGPKP